MKFEFLRVLKGERMPGQKKKKKLKNRKRASFAGENKSNTVLLV